MCQICHVKLKLLRKSSITEVPLFQNCSPKFVEAIAEQAQTNMLHKHCEQTESGCSMKVISCPNSEPIKRADDLNIQNAWTKEDDLD